MQKLLLVEDDPALQFTIQTALEATKANLPVYVSDFSDADLLVHAMAVSQQPDGNWVAYEVSQMDAKADETYSHIWMTSWDGKRTLALTGRGEESETAPRFSPDGHYLAFLSDRGEGEADKDDEAVDQVWLMDRAGGEATKLTVYLGRQQRVGGSVAFVAVCSICLPAVEPHSASSEPQEIEQTSHPSLAAAWTAAPMSCDQYMRMVAAFPVAA